MNTDAVIVTGASGGLGAAIAHQLGRFGTNVVITARQEQGLAETAARVREAGGQAQRVVGDLTDDSVIKQIVDTAVREFGGIQAVVNNAGVLDPIAMVADADVDAWRETFEINFFAPLRLIRAALPHMRHQDSHARIVTISSGAALRGYPAWGAYGASKAAVNHLMQTISAEEPSLTTVALRPGVVDTNMQRKIREEGRSVMPDHIYERFQSLYETGELLDPEEPGLAAAVLALYAPPDWSGQYMNWNEEYVRRLSERYDTLVQASKVETVESPRVDSDELASV